MAYADPFVRLRSITKKSNRSGKKSLATEGQGPSTTPDMTGIHGLPPIIMIPTPTLTPNPNQNVVSANPPLRIEQSAPTHSTPQTESQPSPHSHTTSHSGNHASQMSLGMGSSSSTGSKILIRPVGDRFYPHTKVARTIAKAIKSNFGEGHPSWKKVPADRRKMWFEEFKKAYTWAEADDAQIKKNFEARGSNKYISITKDVRKRKSQPLWMGDLAYATLSAHWQTEQYKELCEKAVANRNVDSGASMHTSGAKPHLSIWEQMTAENDGVAPSLDDFFMRTHKIQKGANVGEWVSPQSQQRFENYSKLKEEVISNVMNDSGEGTSQDDVTQPQNQPSDLAIFAQSVGGKKKG